jgi:hypothetical protein
MAQGVVRYAKPDSANPTGEWTVKTASAARYAAAHGIGVGNINGNGRMDIVNAFGWWERPQTGSTDGPWKYYPQTFARSGRKIMGGSVMAVYDVNGDRLNDVVPVLNAHGWGLAWFEQNKDADGNHRSGTGSDVLPVDLNRDGRMDMVTATRFGTFIFWGQARR